MSLLRESGAQAAARRTRNPRTAPATVTGEPRADMPLGNREGRRIGDDPASQETCPLTVVRPAGGVYRRQAMDALARVIPTGLPAMDDFRLAREVSRA